jgi:hypothetical protein
MPKIVHSNRPNIEHPYAYDEFGSLIAIDESVKISKRAWYLYPNKQVELIPVFDGKIQQAHWRVKSDQEVIINGRTYSYSESKDSESYEHRKVKGDIITNGYFWYGKTKVFITNAAEEVRICDSRFRADISATLYCGTPIVIEVVKTSEISQGKAAYLQQNEILTFKIFIDEKGNQNFDRVDCFGNGKLDGIKESIRKGEGKIAELANEIRTREELSKSIVRAEKSRIAGIQKEINGIGKPKEYGIQQLKQSIIGTEHYISGLKDEIKHLEGEVEKAESKGERKDITGRIQEINREIKRMEVEFNAVEKTFNEIAGRCKIEWFRNKWMKGKVVNLESEIKYWLS